jgi:hypothetical protein
MGRPRQRLLREGSGMRGLGFVHGINIAAPHPATVTVTVTITSKRVSS